MKDGITIGAGVLWTVVWFGFMFLYTVLDVTVWKRLSPAAGQLLNVLSIALCIVIYLQILAKKVGFKPDIFQNASLQGVIIAAACAALLWFALDNGLDPILERLYPASEESYRQAVEALGRAPISSLIRVCILAPVIEEILMRGFLLGGLSQNYGRGAALVISTLIFAIFHFNMVQTLSAVVCGAVLGLLYLHTGSVFCCILAHMAYNSISFAAEILPLLIKK